ncbi:MAG: DNA mismatch endonuclease Vsr [bacterium]|nr:DNA mismatch endonuclease Vsr [bacterium]
MDVFSKEKRSRIMARVRGKNTRPELKVRSLLHRLGYRFRLHRSDLPGNPDIVLPKHKKAVFVHGCFWHGHSGCPRARRPSTNKKFWNEKLDKNIARDKKTISELTMLGWDSLVIWSCETKDMDTVKFKLHSYLKDRESTT